ncbi:MAG: ABC transporter ATP-binding protein [Mailhella sp.]|nr:ABC transporter ATP-binding protein [Mailhella sp.]
MLSDHLHLVSTAASAPLTALTVPSLPVKMLHEGEEGARWPFFRKAARRAPASPTDTSFPLEIRDLHFSYGSRKILDAFSLRIRQGEVCGLLGPNGCGKSTLFRCCMGLLHPREGQIFASGKNIAHISPSELARHIAYVPQEHHQPFPFTVREMVLMGRTPRMAGWFRLNRQDRSIAQEAMERIGIADLSDQPCNQLSGGQRQLVLIARALAQQTPVMLLDEPTSSLDFSNQLAVWRILRDIAKQGVSVLVCCHDPNHLLWFCDNASIMAGGKIFAEGPPRDVITPQTLQHIYGECGIHLYADSNGSIVCPARS